MRIETRADGSLRIKGYVNATECLSNPLMYRGQKLREKIMRGAFGDALNHAKNPITVNIDHDQNRVIASTGNRTAEFYEDNIGLYADITITDPEVIEAVKAGKLKGWSFCFKPIQSTIYQRNGETFHYVRQMELYDVSLIFDRVPAYRKTTAYYVDSFGMGHNAIDKKVTGSNVDTVKSRLNAVQMSDFRRRIAALKK